VVHPDKSKYMNIHETKINRMNRTISTWVQH